MSEFKKLERALKALEQAEERAKRREKNRADWSDPAAKKEYIKLYKRGEREKAIPHPRVCPVCGEAKPKSRQWVVFKRTALSGVSSEQATRARSGGGAKCAVCRSCAMKHFEGLLWKRGR